VLRSSALIVLLLSARVLLAADPPFAEYVPADTKVLIGVEVHAMLDSYWGKAVVEQMQSASGDAWARQLPLKGIDPTKDLDELWIASSSIDRKAPALIILRGRFDKSHLPAAIGRYHAVPLIPLDARREHLLAIMDASTIFSGDRANVERAIDRRGLKAVDAHLATAAAALHARYWIWAVADRLDGVPAAGSAPRALDGLNGFEFGLSLDRDLEIAAQVHLRTAEDAQKLLASLALFEALAKGQRNAGSQMNIENRVAGTNLDFSLRIPEEEVRRAWERQRAAITAQLSQLPQQIAAAQAGKPFTLFAAPAPKPAAANAPSQARRPAPQPSRQTRIVSDEDGNTVRVTLPGR
jgi:hypothetical protein